MHMFKNALVYRIDHWDPPALGVIEQCLSGMPFIECAATQPESAGWVPPRGEAHAALAESVGGQWLMTLCTETKAVPSAVVKTQLQAQLTQIEQQTGRRPKGKQARELKEDVIHALLPRAFPKRAHTLVWIDREAGRVWIDAVNARRADAVVTRLIELLGNGLKLSLMQTALSPSSAMAGWLADKQAPARFSIDRECELKQPDNEKAVVRYARHTLDIDEVAEHIRQGKRPTRLAMTWADRVSFVLTDTLALKKIELLDVVLEGAGIDAAQSGKDGGGFEADAAITTGELRLLLADLTDALGGVQEDRSAPAEPNSAAPDAAPSTAPWDHVPA
jgi:recombination associated protein RdgC